MTDGTFAVQATDKGSGTGHGFACAELAALEYDSQQRRALGDAVRCFSCMRVVDCVKPMHCQLSVETESIHRLLATFPST